MKASRLVLQLMLLAAAVVPAAGPSASAAQVHVDIFDYFFAPGGNILPAGSNVVLFNRSSQGDHEIQAYYGASFHTDLLRPGRGTIVSYPGGTVLYRCVLHSTLTYGQTPPSCSGMCGVLQSEQDYVPPAVTITTPDAYRFTGAVRIDGRATDDRSVVQVYLTFTPLLYAPYVSAAHNTRATCYGCGLPSLTWRATETSLQAGRYEVRAHAVDAGGNTSTSAPITIVALAPRFPSGLL